MTLAEPFEIAGTQVAPGTVRNIEIPISRLANGSPIGLQIRIVNGKRPGPTLFVSSAVHGDEIIGLEIIRRLIERPLMKKIKGTLILVPIVNSYGFLNRSRYLPDRRDLNRCFPGSPKGSLAARLANEFLEKVVARSDYGIDIHSAAIHRENLPQIRIGDEGEQLLDLAKAFGAPVIMKSRLREGSLRESAFNMDVPTLVYEAGEGLRFDETAIRAGLAGIMRVMAHADMFDTKKVLPPRAPSFVADGSSWVRAPEGGLLRLFKKLGDPVEKGERLGTVSDVFGDNQDDVLAPVDGIVIGRASLPVINEGDAVAHIAHATRAGDISLKMEKVVGQLERATMFYEDEIV